MRAHVYDRSALISALRAFRSLYPRALYPAGVFKEYLATFDGDKDLFDAYHMYLVSNVGLRRSAAASSEMERITKSANAVGLSLPKVNP